ncbi:hypothetical protein RCL_jg9949.t1 [Rhizophagus clarus]|uniref:Uncharacterized protein n=1 Tax=Rhizophagus clarus TaxID=94130 RepID=A0A8H3KV29_9GLOM|nr:hypothetical protein RCL_jg9949.t1 [Rhizophagus clarus]
MPEKILSETQSIGHDMTIFDKNDTSANDDVHRIRKDSNSVAIMSDTSEFFEIIESLELEEEMNKLQIYLIKNYEEGGKLFLAFKVLKQKNPNKDF